MIARFISLVLGHLFAWQEVTSEQLAGPLDRISNILDRISAFLDRGERLVWAVVFILALYVLLRFFSITAPMWRGLSSWLFKR